MPRALLILPTAGYRTEDFLAAASALDVEVVVATDRRQTIGDAIRIDLRRPERAADAIVELARDRPLDAVVAADAGVPQPRFTELPPGGDVAAVGFPAVLKPAGLAMGRGVIRADDAAGARSPSAGSAGSWPPPATTRRRRSSSRSTCPESRSPSRLSCAAAGW